MSMLKYIRRMKRMDDLIRRRATGTPDQFAEALGISKSMLMINLTELKELGAPVKFNFVEQTYYYERNCRLLLEFRLPDEERALVKGGSAVVDFTIFEGMVSLYPTSHRERVAC